MAAATVLIWTWRLIWSLTAVETAALATRKASGRTNSDLILLAGSVVSLVAVGLVLVRANQETNTDKGLLVSLSVASIVLAWSTMSIPCTACATRASTTRERTAALTSTTRPAVLYRTSPILALTIGMTFQVSDTDLQTNAFRRLALRHALLSYLFGALIIATTINLIAGLGH